MNDGKDKKHMTATEIVRRWQEYEMTTAQRVALAKQAAANGDSNALDALAELALRYVELTK